VIPFRYLRGLALSVTLVQTGISWRRKMDKETEGLEAMDYVLGEKNDLYVRGYT